MTYEWQNLNHFWFWISERQKIFYRRYVVLQPPPWSSDKVMRDTHWTNVYRELDPGTTWLIHNVLENDLISVSERAFVAMAYRLFGTESVFTELEVPAMRRGHKLLPESFDQDWLARQLQAMMDDKRQAFTSAYMVSNYGRSEPKSVVIADVLAQAARNWPTTSAALFSATTRQGAFAAINSVHGIGKFLAFQVLVDLCYPLGGMVQVETVRMKPVMRAVGILPFSNNGWVMPGPGAERGLTHLLGEKAKVSGDHGDKAIAALVKMQRAPLDSISMPWLRAGKKGAPVLIDRSNMQNCLCEFSKYMRLLGEIDSGVSKGGRKRQFNDSEAAARPIKDVRDNFSPFTVQVDAFAE